MIYLDNSSTTHKKPLSVKYSVINGVCHKNINASRASYRIAIKIANEIYETREILSNLVNTTPENIIFTSGCTMALNTAIFGTAITGGHIITSIFEHNSTLRALEKLKTTHKISITYLTPNKQGKIQPSDITKNIKQNTYLIIINHTSNVTGDTQDIEAIGKICKKHNILFMVDGAQSVGHEKIDMQKMNINLLAIAGHKGLYSISGIGVLAINNCKVEPLLYGGTGTYSESTKQPQDYPDGLESGTQNLIGILSLKAGANFVIKNQQKINLKIKKLSTKLIYNLNRIKNVNCYSINTNSGVISFTINGKDSVQVSNMLEQKYNIGTRSGLHCAPLVHKYFNTLKNGMTRVSLSYYNNSHEINKLIKAIKKIALD